MKSIKRIFIILIMAIGILAFNQVQAFEVFQGETNVKGGRFFPYKISGESGTWFCIQGHAAYSASMPRGYKEGQSTQTYREREDKPSPEWTGVKKSMIYDTANRERISMQYYQDTAYILTDIKASGNGYSVRGGYERTGQFAIWSTPVNIGVKEAPNALGKEAAVYKKFYEYIHNVRENYDDTDFGKDAILNSNGEGGDEEENPDEVVDPTEGVIISYRGVSQKVDEENINIFNMSLSQFQSKIRELIKAQIKNEQGREMTSAEIRKLDTYSKEYYNNNYEKDEYADMYNEITRISYDGIHEIVQSENIDLGDYTSKNSFALDMIEYYRTRINMEYEREINEKEKKAVKYYADRYYNENITNYLNSPDDEAQDGYINNGPSLNWGSNSRLASIISVRSSVFVSKTTQNRSGSVADAGEIFKDYLNEAIRKDEEGIKITYQDVVNMVKEFDVDVTYFTQKEFVAEMKELFSDKIRNEYGRSMKAIENQYVKKYSEQFYKNHIYGTDDTKHDVNVNANIKLSYDGIGDKVRQKNLYIRDYTLEAFQNIMVEAYKEDIRNAFSRDISDTEIEMVKKYSTQYYQNNGEGGVYDPSEDEVYDPYEHEENTITNKDGQSDSTDIYVKLLKDKTDAMQLRTMLDRKEGYYIVGPFNISYPEGRVNGINKFSWVKNVTVYDQNNKDIANIANKTLQIINKEGQLIYDTDNEGNRINVPKNQENFYIKFYTRDALSIKMKIDFGYLESCSAEAYRVAGQFVEWSWDRVKVGTHRYDCGEHSHYHCDRIKYVLRKEVTGTTQTLMQVLEAHRNYKEASMVIPYSEPDRPDRPDRPDEPDRPDKPNKRKEIKLTMEISGKVFLDQDQGKANEGNNVYDAGEQLEGIDVWLFDKDNKFEQITVTDENGNYVFKDINAMKEYYVCFAYNGMLYTNVEYKEYDKNNIEQSQNWSQATEVAQEHTNNRIDFNKKFAQIGSYPQNYTTTDCINGGQITNKVFEQGDIITLYKEVAKAMKEKNGDTKAAYQSVIDAHSSDSEIKAKVQFIADCRINSYTVKRYANDDAIVISKEPYTIGTTTYYETYYQQYHVNLGIKSRPTFDLAIYKDTVKADVKINGKNETYTYDARKDTTGKGFAVGVSESDYLNSVREGYLRSKNYENGSTRQLETDYYDTDLRAEEVANGKTTDYINQGKKVDQKYNVKDTNIYANYTNLDIQNGANKEDRLKIFIQYRISVRNQSGVVGAVTEVVDYFDTNYKFVEAYEGDINGNKIADVSKHDNSMYGSGTEFKNNSKYTTIYLRPERENRLHNENKEQYIYVTLQLLGPQNDAGDFLKTALLNDGTISVLNVAEINGYKTYDSTTGDSTPGLVDIDSNPGNFDITSIGNLNEESIKKYLDIYEDDTSRAPAMVYRLLESRTIEGTVFEDSTGKNSEKLNTAKVREGNGLLDKGEKGIKDVIVQLVEIKNGQMVTRAETRTNNDGWYGFTGFIPGDYTIRYIYGSDDQTAMNKTSWYSGSNDTSYNGQDYQSTKFTAIQGGTVTDKAYKTDTNLIERYRNNYNNKDNINQPIESTVSPLESTTIKQYQDAFYWYTNTNNAFSDAQDDEYRKQLVINYAKSEYETEIANYKAEVFNSYLPKDKQPSHMTDAYMRQLANELERRTYRYAYTPEITIEVEYAKRQATGNMKNKKKDYEHAIKGVDFGIVERPKSKIELTKNVEHIKVTTTDGAVLYDTSGKTANLAWTVKKDRYKKTDPILVTMDDELLNGATIEITYKFTVTNKSELGENGNSVIAAKNILDYIDNSLTFNAEDNKGMWEVVSPDSIQNATKSTLLNNYKEKDAVTKNIDISTIQTIVKTTENNPLTKNLAVGETTEGTLVLRKVLATESDIAQLTYDNIAEIVEVKQIVGRHDHTSTPGNQDPEKDNEEDDTYEAETVKILPPFGVTSVTIYFVIGAIALAILGGGVLLIKKYVVKK